MALTLQVMEGFDHLATAQLLLKYPGSTGGGTNYYTGGRNNSGYQSPGTGALILVLPTTIATDITLGVGIYPQTMNASGATILQFMDSATNQFDLRYDATKHLYFTRNGTVIGSVSVAALPFQTWSYVEIQVHIAGTTNGTVKCWVNESLWIDSSGLNSQNSANAQVTSVKIGDIGSADVMYFDDLYICSGTGTPYGDVRVETVTPNGAGNYTEWTPSAGANYQCVDEIPATVTSEDYISTATAGARDTYTHAAIPTASGTVLGVQLSAVLKKDDAGTRTYRRFLRSGGTDDEGADYNMSTSYEVYKEILPQNPVGPAAWTIASVNALEFGNHLQA